MKIIQGKNLIELSKEDFTTLLSTFKRVEIDLGTGDGRFIYKNAIPDPESLFIGVEPNKKQLEIYAKKANKDKVKNALYIVGTAEELPQELESTASSIHIILPWGTLLKYTAQPDHKVLSKIAALLKIGGALKVILGYSKDFEPSEFERLDLENINGEYIEKTLIPEYKKLGLRMTKMNILNRKALKSFESTWCKKLSFGKNRPMFYLEFVRC